MREAHPLTLSRRREGNYHEESLNCSLGLPNICTPACAACVMPALVRCLARLPAHPSWKQAQRFGGICLSVKSPAVRELAKAVKQHVAARAQT